MSQSPVDREIQWRLYCWAQATIAREVAEGFPLLHNCQHNRRVRCFLTWMKEMDTGKRLPVCQLLAKRAYEQVTLAKGAECDPFAAEAFEQRNNAVDMYHHRLSPTPDADVFAPGFIKANLQKCRDAIIKSLEPICDSPRRRQPQKIWYFRKYGDWILTTYVEMRRILSPNVECCHFLRRSDSENPMFGDSRIYASDRMTRIDPLILFGISSSEFPLIGRSHEQLCAHSVRAVVESFIPSVPKLVSGL